MRKEMYEGIEEERMRACCQCVPAGTSGNKTMCPCYANLRTHGLKPKCP
ncbi:Gibberellin-regulated protein 9 [Ananas comosus]|uniref:Gibberellin-regulated protein 9 n=1 Tax=Ananas comosus TaxID=4615 RepID=A0A199VRT1_ANACO|nr:Gibberellin-regulated protein 9 [Ananas comosus]